VAWLTSLERLAVTIASGPQARLPARAESGDCPDHQGNAGSDGDHRRWRTGREVGNEQRLAPGQPQRPLARIEHADDIEQRKQQHTRRDPRALACVHAAYLTRMPGCGPGVGREQEDAGRLTVGIRGGQDHSLGQAELHLARREVGDHHRQPADQRRRIVGRLDAGKDLPRAERADVEQQANELVGAIDVRRLADAGDAQVDAA
jgi:hypothetical protein